MSLDFTLSKYSELLQSFLDKGYRFITFEEYCLNKELPISDSFVILRHDVDLDAENSLATAKIEHALGILASYYFRVVKQSNKPGIIKDIVDLGHEIGYHYEDMSICGGDVEKALKHFEQQLAYFRRFYPVKTICMHGAPRSKFDSKDLWKSNKYQDFGIIGEPYFDVDFSKVFYLTDTGRRWDGFHVSVRDKIPVYQDEWIKQGLVYRTSDGLIKAVSEGSLPKQLMMTTHPQRWTNNIIFWLKELCSQSVKNMVKGMLMKSS